MLNSVSDLHGYIDKSQLTQELGGTLEYRHSQWLNHRTVSTSWCVQKPGEAEGHSCEVTAQGCLLPGKLEFLSQGVGKMDGVREKAEVCSRTARLPATSDLGVLRVLT